MICPACKNPMMVMEYNKIELDYCNNCKGVWFDNAELDLLMKSMNLPEDSLLLKNMLSCPEATSAEKKRKCPMCSKTMKLVKVGDSQELVIDVCHNGHGLWFDGGELPLLLKQEAKRCGPEHSADIYSFLSEAFEFKGKAA
jgi:uncharacterized protein